MAAEVKEKSKRVRAKDLPARDIPQVMTEDEPQSYDVDPAEIKMGDVHLFPYFGRVEEKSLGRLAVTGAIGSPEQFSVIGDPLITGSYSADYYKVTRKVTRTNMAERLVHSNGKPFTAKFITKDGEDYTVRARFLSWEQMFGRSHVVNLDAKTKDDQHKQVCHRTLYELIIGGVRFILKK